MLGTWKSLKSKEIRRRYGSYLRMKAMTEKRRQRAVEATEEHDDEHRPIKRSRTGLVTSKTTQPAFHAHRLNHVPKAPTHLLNVYVFGSGSMNELGMADDDVDVIYRPRLNPSLTREKAGVVTLAVGGMHTAVVTHDGRVLTWGVNDDFALGRLTKNQVDEDGEPIDNDTLEGTPYPVEGELLNKHVVKVVCSDNLTVAITDEGECYAWGTFRCSDGILGFSATQKHSPSPTKIDIPEVADVAVGTDHVLALTTAGQVYAWGNGQQCQLGREIPEAVRKEGLVPHLLNLKNILAVGAGSYHSFAVDRDGRVYAWGLNAARQCGIYYENNDEGVIVKEPTLVEALAPFKVESITGGEHHSMAILRGGRVLAWGRHDRHQLGIPEEELPSTVLRDDRGNIYSVPIPTIVPSLVDIVQVCCGTHHNLAIDKHGKAFSWGSGENYEVGQGTDDEDVAIPTLIRSKAIKDVAIKVVGAGGQFSVIAGLPTESTTPKITEKTPAVVRTTEDVSSQSGSITSAFTATSSVFVKDTTVTETVYTSN
ncbi:ran GDP/GTP exchange factor [Schizosaccharomyces japonicus yFS275]|uniref:Ran GDP/GTP exchange factor n=1 Tax=Schizosaccharomyces japonicus (strain yFS275 / FY16936) TaxID=402676 RepID=B6K6W4_SCHJY|nr:ran GDP/GTP exchange factor [Schizosaccharomyces japonicus yFS275]EEB09268.1 ran GDP/GTP exchange factor [Schizosaccharomyces japonicus yFS275]